MKESVTSSGKGGSFLLDASSTEDVFTPEDFSEEHELIREMTRQFVEAEVVPRIEEIESKDWEVTTSLLRRCGELGLLGIEVPEKYGGESLDKVSAMIVQEQLGRVGSFAVSYGGHAGIGTLPIVYFGTEDQKLEYLPRFCKAELVTSYALSEASSGSDALAARTRASRSEDGKHWILSGEKNVDHERCIRRCLRDVRSGRRREVQLFHRREELSRRLCRHGRKEDGVAGLFDEYRHP